mmetsp:Transcript_5028/g.12663  ORF Transcript_5028/g.12663 Transcript_5028/m.12663 type:complete len:297 (-) Transcript_5028:2042-2932(-)
MGPDPLQPPRPPSVDRRRESSSAWFPEGERLAGCPTGPRTDRVHSRLRVDSRAAGSGLRRAQPPAAPGRLLLLLPSSTPRGNCSPPPPLPPPRSPARRPGGSPWRGCRALPAAGPESPWQGSSRRPGAGSSLAELRPAASGRAAAGYRRPPEKEPRDAQGLRRRSATAPAIDVRPRGCHGRRRAATRGGTFGSGGSDSSAAALPAAAALPGAAAAAEPAAPLPHTARGLLQLLRGRDAALSPRIRCPRPPRDRRRRCPRLESGPGLQRWGCVPNWWNRPRARGSSWTFFSFSAPVP